MSDVKWIKITTDIFDDEKVKIIDTMPDNDAILVIWFKLLTLAGKVNEDGYLYMNNKTPYTLDMLAAIFNHKKTTINLALKTFEQFEMIEIEDNDLINIKNWGKHQNIEGLEKIRKQRRERVRKYREKKKQKQLSNGNVTGNVTETLSNGTEREEELEEEIDIEYKNIKDMYNNYLGDKFDLFPKCVKITSKRRNKIKSRVDDGLETIEDWEELFKKVSYSEFLTGKNDREFVADLNWLIKNDTNYIKVLEGKYDNKLKKQDKDDPYEGVVY